MQNPSTLLSGERMTLTQLEYIYTIFQCSLNFTAAARQLHVTQPCISNSIRDLEKELGTALFHRVNKKTLPTQAAKICYDYSVKILYQMDQMNYHLRLLSEQTNLIRIGIPATLGSPCIYQFITDCRSQIPNLAFDIIEGVQPDLIKQLQENKIHFLIGNGNTRHLQEAREDLLSIPLFQTEFMVCTAPDHPLARRSRITLSDLAGEQVVFTRTKDEPTHGFMPRFADAGISIRRALFVEQTNSAKELIRTGAYIGFFYKIMLHPSEPFSMIPFEPRDFVPVVFLYKKERALSHAEILFIDFVQKYSFSV